MPSNARAFICSTLGLRVALANVGYVRPDKAGETRTVSTLGNFLETRARDENAPPRSIDRREYRDADASVKFNRFNTSIRNRVAQVNRTRG